MRYEEFSIQILPGAARGCAVRVQSPAGNTHGSFEIPAGLRGGSEREGSAAARDLVRPAAATYVAAATPRQTGERLFRALFSGRVLRLFDRSLPDPRRQPDCGLRIRLRIDASLAEVVALPWELLSVPDTRDFLALSRRTPVVRSFDVLRSARPAPRVSRLRILAVASQPHGFEPLDLAAELRHLRAAFRWRWNVEVVVLEKAGRDELRDALLASAKRPFHILHFMGHGSFDGEHGAVLLEGPGGVPQPVTGEDLAAELKDTPALQLIVLNVCHSAQAAARSGLDPFTGVAAALLLAGIPAVVAMRAEVPDGAAVVFARDMYWRLAQGDAVDAAVAEGRLAIQRRGDDPSAWSLPVLFLAGSSADLFRTKALCRQPVAIAAAAGLALAIAAGGQAVRMQRGAEVLRLNNEGAVLAAEGREDEARRRFLSALRLRPDDAATHANLASLDEQNGDYAAALGHAEAAADATPAEPLYHYNLGRLLARLGREAEALRSLERAAHLAPCSAPTFNELGNVYLQLERLAEARGALESGLACPPLLPPLLKNLGRVALAEGRTEEAVRRLDEALRLYARTGWHNVEEPTYWSAEAHARAGHRELACHRLDELIRSTAGVSPWADAAERLARRQRCDFLLASR